MQLNLRNCFTGTWLRGFILLSCLLSSWLLTIPSIAQTGGTSSGGTSGDNTEWGPEIRKVDDFLRKHKWKLAHRNAKSLANKIIGRSWHTPNLDKILAELAFAQAVADANLYNDRLALWYWHMACNLNFRIRRRDLSPYGEASKLLGEFPLRSLGQMPANFENLEVTPLVRSTPPVAPDITPPRVLANTAAAREGTADFHVEVVVDKYGQIHHPVVRSDYVHPVITYATLKWLLKLDAFEPGTVEGKATDRLFPLVVDYHVERW